MVDTNHFRSYGVGTKAFIDGFGPMVPVTVIEILENNANGLIIGHKQIRVRVDKTMGGYRKGEELLQSAAHCPPRKQRFLRDYFYRINVCYKYVKSFQNQN